MSTVAIDALIGHSLGPSEWREVTQERIDAFATATDDPLWIHTDPVRAAAGPYGTTVAPGFLTLSLSISMLFELLPAAEHGPFVVYGHNRVRYPAPVPVGCRIRTVVKVEDVVATSRGDRVTLTLTVEREGGERPVCVAELVLLRVA
jgi:acyl dehydratase